MRGGDIDPRMRLAVRFLVGTVPDLEIVADTQPLQHGIHQSGGRGGGQADGQPLFVDLRQGGMHARLGFPGLLHPLDDPVNQALDHLRLGWSLPGVMPGPVAHQLIDAQPHGLQAILV